MHIGAIGQRRGLLSLWHSGMHGQVCLHVTNHTWDYGTILTSDRNAGLNWAQGAYTGLHMLAYSSNLLS